MSVFGVILVRIFRVWTEYRHSASVSLRIQSQCEKICTRITPNTDTFYAVSLAVLRKSEMYNVTTNVIFHIIFGFIQKLLKEEKKLLHRHFSRILLRFEEHCFSQPVSMAFSKIAHLTYQTFCLGLLRPFAVSFYLCTTETTHSRDILLPDILLTVLQVFEFCLILPFLLHQF